MSRRINDNSKNTKDILYKEDNSLFGSLLKISKNIDSLMSS